MADSMPELTIPVPKGMSKKKSEHVQDLELKIRKSYGKKKETKAGNVLVE